MRLELDILKDLVKSIKIIPVNVALSIAYKYTYKRITTVVQ